MKAYFWLFFCCLWAMPQMQAQRHLPDQTKLKAGYLLYANYQLYQRYQKPTSFQTDFPSSGQVLNILPGIGTGFWLGKPYKWWLSVESGLEYAPFTLDLNRYKGMGSLAIPLLLKANLPVARQHSTIIALHFGAGAQWTMSEMYARPEEFRSSENPFFVTYVAEFGVSLGAVDMHLDKMRDLAFYVRMGWGLRRAHSLQVGLRVSIWNGQ